MFVAVFCLLVCVFLGVVEVFSVANICSSHDSCAELVAAAVATAALLLYG